MMSLTNVAPYLRENVWVLILLISIGGLFKFWQYVDLSKREESQVRFKNYHELIKNLTQPDNAEMPIKLDRQIASVYELRGFPEYRDVTIRILNGWRAEWTDQPKIHYRLNREMELTLEFLSHSLLYQKWRGWSKKWKAVHVNVK